MANRSLNQVMLLGNLTRDPDLRYTPNGTPVITFSMATNRRWKTQTGELKDEAQFHRIVAWNKLAELLGQLLQKGTRVLVEGRLQYRKWTDQSGAERQTTEIVASDVIVLDRAKAAPTAGVDVEPEAVEAAAAGITTPEDQTSSTAAPAAPAGAEKTEEKPESTASPEATPAPAEEKTTENSDTAKEEKKEDKEKADDEMPF